MFSHIFTLVSGFAGLRPNVLLRFAQKPEEFMICYVSFALQPRDARSGCETARADPRWNVGR